MRTERDRARCVAVFVGPRCRASRSKMQGSRPFGPGRSCLRVNPPPGSRYLPWDSPFQTIWALWGGGNIARVVTLTLRGTAVIRHQHGSFSLRARARSAGEPCACREKFGPRPIFKIFSLDQIRVDQEKHLFFLVYTYLVEWVNFENRPRPKFFSARARLPRWPWFGFDWRKCPCASAYAASVRSKKNKKKKVRRRTDIRHQQQRHGKFQRASKNSCTLGVTKST